MREVRPAGVQIATRLHARHGADVAAITGVSLIVEADRRWQRAAVIPNDDIARLPAPLNARHAAQSCAAPSTRRICPLTKFASGDRKN